MSQSLIAAVGWSGASEGVRAGHDAVEAARSRLGSHRPHAALVFGSSWFDQAGLMEGIRQALPEVPLIGASTAGEILPEGPVSHSCVVVLVSSEGLTWSVGAGEPMHVHPREAGQQAAYAAARNFRASPRIGFILLGDGLATQYAEMLRGIQEVVGTGSVIVGAMAGDDLRFTQTFQYANGQVFTHAVVGALIGGEGKLGIGMEHGFAPIGKPRRISRATANILIELDGQPAARIYEEYFGAEFVRRMREEGLTREAIAYPLGVQTNSHWLLRRVLALQDGALVCSNELREGAWTQFMIGSKESALEATQRATQQALRALNRVALVLVFNSVIRRQLLGPQLAAQEIAQIRQVIGPSVPLAGCYTYGEQAPVSTPASGPLGSVSQTGAVLILALGA